MGKEPHVVTWSVMYKRLHKAMGTKIETIRITSLHGMQQGDCSVHGREKTVVFPLFIGETAFNAIVIFTELHYNYR